MAERVPSDEDQLILNSISGPQNIGLLCKSVKDSLEQCDLYLFADQSNIDLWGLLLSILLNVLLATKIKTLEFVVQLRLHLVYKEPSKARSSRVPSVVGSNSLRVIYRFRVTWAEVEEPA